MKLLKSDHMTDIQLAAAEFEEGCVFWSFSVLQKREAHSAPK